MANDYSTIAYLLGAGASANCLPVVCNMANGIQEVINNLDKIVENGSELKISLSRVFDSLNELRDICKINHSVDTYAKKLYIAGKSDQYNNLKDSLTLYFTLQQKMMLLDNRYDNFWAAILNSRVAFPNNLRVLSWNYDSQVELSYMDFTMAKKLTDAYEKLNMVSMHSDLSYFSPDKFSIVKLNGSAKYRADSYRLDNFNYLVDDFEYNQFNEDFFEELVEKFEDISLIDKTRKRRVNINELSFAWEHKVDSDFHKQLKLTLKDVSVIAVIGYSFPIYNRKIDKIIINDYMPKLEKVYLQAPDADDLRDRFLAITDRIPNNKIILNKDIAQFVFPNELDI